MQVTVGTIRLLIREAAAERWRPRRKDYEQGRVTPAQKFYHASPRRFRNGDILTGGRSGGYGSCHTSVCMTTSPDPHATIRSRIPGWSGYDTQNDEIDVEDFMSPGRLRSQVDADWYVYEVEPIGDVSYVADNAEYQARAARVVRNVGKATSFLKKRGDSGLVGALSPARDRHRAAKYADRAARRSDNVNRDGEVDDDE